MAMTKNQAALWVAAELAKVKTAEQAAERLASHQKSVDGFFNSPAGQASAKSDPHARQARHDLAAAIRAQFKL